MILDAIRCIVRDLRESSRAAEAEVGVSGAQLFVLHKLAVCGVASVNQLAESTLTHQSSVSAVVARLAELGLVTRQRSTIDGRQIDVALTRRGALLSRRAPEAAQDRLITAVAKLATADRRPPTAAGSLPSCGSSPKPSPAIVRRPCSSRMPTRVTECLAWRRPARYRSHSG